MREDPASVVASQENELPDENKDILKIHDVFPSEMPDDITTKHPKQIIYQITYSARGALFYQLLQKAFVDHVLAQHNENNVGIQLQKQRHLRADPLGLNPPPFTNSQCWTPLRRTRDSSSSSDDNSEENDDDNNSGGANELPDATNNTTVSASTIAGPADAASATVDLTHLGPYRPQVNPSMAEQYVSERGQRYAKTQFLITLEHHQRAVYLHLRATLAKFMCKLSFTCVENFISDADEKTPKRDRLKKAHRVPWGKIVTFILLNLCRSTLGSHHYLQVHTVMREDDEHFHTWCKTVRKIVAHVKNHGDGWETVVDKEALTVLIDWLSEQEERALNSFLVKQGLHNKHPNLPGMAQELTLNEFITIFKDIKPKELPSKFTRSKQVKTLGKTLIPYTIGKTSE